MSDRPSVPAPSSSSRSLPPLPPLPELPSSEGRPWALSFDVPLRDFRDELEREYVKRLLKRHGGNVTAAAQEAGIDRTYIYRLVKKHEP